MSVFVRDSAPERDAAPARDAELDAAVLPDVALDAAVFDAAPDQSVPDVAPPDASSCGQLQAGATGFVGTTGADGRLVVRAADAVFRVRAVSAGGADGQPVEGASVGALLGGGGFSVSVWKSGTLGVTALGETRASGAVVVDGAAQLVGGPAVVSRPEVPVAPEPGCDPALPVIDLEAILPTQSRTYADVASGGMLLSRCADAPELASTCALLGRSLQAQGGLGAGHLGAEPTPAPDALALEPGGLPRLFAPVWRDALPTVCADRGGLVPVRYTDGRDAAMPPLSTRFDAAIGRLAGRLTGGAPGERPVSDDRLVRLHAFASALVPLIRPNAVEVHGADSTFFEQSGLLVAATYGQALGRAGDLPRDFGFEAPWQGWLIEGTSPAFDGLGLAWQRDRARQGFGPAATGCDLVVVERLLATGEGLEVRAAETLDYLIRLLEAGLDAADAEAAPLPPDMAPRLDAGPPPEDAAPPEADAAPPEPDAFVELPPCGPDVQEPNNGWRDVVGDGERYPRNMRRLEDLTLMPGDEDWYAFESGLINPMLGADLGPDRHCDAPPGGRLCIQTYFYSWVNYEGLLDDALTPLEGPVCGPVDDVVRTMRQGIGGLAGEPWTSIVVHVTHDGAGASPVPYRVDVSR
jgi:hypothetical protein